MKLARVNDLHLTVQGNVRTVILSPGAVVDLDQVVGHAGGQSRTLAQELRPDWLSHVEVLAAETDPPTAARRGAARPAPPSRPSPSTGAGPTHAQEKE
jgi:hypothetical protein